MTIESILETHTTRIDNFETNGLPYFSSLSLVLGMRLDQTHTLAKPSRDWNNLNGTRIGYFVHNIMTTVVIFKNCEADGISRRHHGILG